MGVKIIGLCCLLLAAIIVLVYFIWIKDSTNREIGTLPLVKSFSTEWDYYPITSMHIRSSHNSYLGESQYATEVHTDYLVNALNLGARCIELDIGWKNGEAVVSHGNASIQVTANSIPFKYMLAVLEELAFKQVNDPLIICIELQTPALEVLSNTVADMLKNSKLPLFNREDFNLQHLLLSKIPIKYLRNQVLVFSNSQCDSLKSMDGSKICDYHNKGSEDNSVEQMQPLTDLNRLYMEGPISILGGNIDPSSYMKTGFGIVGMNFGKPDNALYYYLKSFGEYCIKPMDGTGPLPTIEYFNKRFNI